MRIIENDEVDSRIWELYRISCQNSGTTPTIRDFVIWLEENYE